MTGRALTEPGGSGQGLPQARTNRRILFRYRPTAGTGRDLALRYRRPVAAVAGGSEPQTALVRVRWFSDVGRVLLWERPRRTIRLPTGPEWTPLPLDIPPPPRDSAFLRFDIIVERDGERLALCTGFVQPGAPPVADDFEVLALGAAFDGDGTGLPPSPVTTPGVILPARRLGRDGSGLLVLDAGSAADISSIRIANWPGTGRPLLDAPVGEAGPAARVLLALPEAGLTASEAEIGVRRPDGYVSRASIRVAGGRSIAGGNRVRQRLQVAAVVTSCGRQDLLEKTLDSFFACNTYPVAQTIVVEDGPSEANAALARTYAERNITWLGTGRRVGQIAAIDYAYAFVETPYIFHLEDDWQFYRTGFIEKSLAILEARPDCLQVWIRALGDTNRHPVAPDLEDVDGIAVRKLLGYLDRWHGFSFNPGLRRRADYDRIGQYSWHVRYDPADPDGSERRISAIFKELGFYAVILADNDGKGYVRHLGFGRRVVDRAAVGW